MRCDRQKKSDPNRKKRVPPVKEVTTDEVEITQKAEATAKSADDIKEVVKAINSLKLYDRVAGRPLMSRRTALRKQHMKLDDLYKPQ